MLALSATQLLRAIASRLEHGIACCSLLGVVVETVSPIVGHSGAVSHDKFVPLLVAGHLGKLLCLALLGCKLLPKRCQFLVVSTVQGLQDSSTGASQVCASQVCLSQVCVIQACASQVCVSQVCVKQVCVRQVCASQVCARQVCAS